VNWRRWKLPLTAVLFLCIIAADSSSYAFNNRFIEKNYSTSVFSEDGKLIGYIGEKNCVAVYSMSQVSRYAIEALIATEDRDFFRHDGVSVRGVLRATMRNIEGSREGGSTITMQLARNLYLSSEKTISRKLKEVNIALDLERKFTKQEILLMYLNTVYFGRGSYGIWAASQEYFSKTPDKLSVTESALLVGLLKAPNQFDPITYPDRAIKRRNIVLSNMVATGQISRASFDKYKNRPLGLRIREYFGLQFLEYVRLQATQIVKDKGLTFNQGLRIYTTLNSKVQIAAEATIREEWKSYPDNMKSAQVAMATVDIAKGKIVSMIGGNPYSPPRGLNRAAQSKRQTGSTFKPFVYAALFERGYAIGSPNVRSRSVYSRLVTDNYVLKHPGPKDIFPNPDSTHIRVLPINLNEAIRKSLNPPVQTAIVKFTNPHDVIAVAKRCGIVSPLRNDITIALGSNEVTPLEMASAFTVFPAQGYHHNLIAITRIEDSNGNTIYQSSERAYTAISPEAAWFLTKAMQGVPTFSGTGYRIPSIYKGVAAGKTGTTDDSRDAWFIGFNTQLCTAVWVGFDQPKSLPPSYSYGGLAAAPIWAKFMLRVSQIFPAAFNRNFQEPGIFSVPQHPTPVRITNEQYEAVSVDKQADEPVHR